jgi:hypothetical protein
MALHYAIKVSKDHAQVTATWDIAVDTSDTELISSFVLTVEGKSLNTQCSGGNKACKSAAYATLSHPRHGLSGDLRHHHEQARCAQGQRYPSRREDLRRSRLLRLIPRSKTPKPDKAVSLTSRQSPITRHSLYLAIQAYHVRARLNRKAKLTCKKSRRSCGSTAKLKRPRTSTPRFSKTPRSSASLVAAKAVPDPGARSCP